MDITRVATAALGTAAIRRSGSAGFLLAVLVVSGCSSSVNHTVGAGSGQPAAATSGPASTLSASPTTLVSGLASYSGSVSTASTDQGSGIIFEPPSASDRPTVTWPAAVSACTSGTGSCLAGHPEHVSLAVVTDTNAGPTTPSGAIIPIMDHSLVYVVAQDGLSCAPSGSVSGGLATQSCTKLTFVDAHSGAVLYATEGPTVADPASAR